MQPPAFLAVCMLMGEDVAVKALFACVFELADCSLPGKQFKVAVDRAQADAGQPLPHKLINFICCRVNSSAAQFFEYNTALLRHALLLRSNFFHPDNKY